MSDDRCSDSALEQDRVGDRREGAESKPGGAEAKKLWTRFRGRLELEAAALWVRRMIDPRQLGQRLRQIREARGISQGRLARLIGVSVGTVQNYEHGRNPIPTDRLEPLAMALQCKPAELLAEPGSPPPRYRPSAHAPP